jgi:hypothetical protein
MRAEPDDDELVVVGAGVVDAEDDLAGGDMARRRDVEVPLRHVDGRAAHGGRA